MIFIKGCIYIIRNTVNGKVYIGQTTYTHEFRFKEHVKRANLGNHHYKIYNAMHEIGADKFYSELLEDDIDIEDIDDREVYYIKKYKAFSNGYNSTKGGDGRNIIRQIDVDKFKKLYKTGMIYKEMAKHFNVGAITIMRTAKKLKLKRYNKITKEILLNNLELTNIEIAKLYDVHPETISRAFKKYNIKRGKGCNNHKRKHNK